MTTRQAVDKLLQQYGDYKKRAEAIQNARRRLAKQKLTGVATTEAQQQLVELEKAQVELSDAMTFATPLIWLMYKFEAYQDEPQPIRTLHDFRLHCSKPGYICTKRFNFLNAYLQKVAKTPLTDRKTYPDSMLLSQLFPEIEKLNDDASFLDEWRSHEYYQEDGIVKKWQDVD